MLALDVLLLVMIAICVAYCFILNKRIQDLHNSRVEFARMIKEFDAAIVKADKAIVSMTALGKNTSEQTHVIQELLKESERTCTELNMFSGLGGKVAERLEKTIDEARKLEKMDIFTSGFSRNEKHAIAPKSQSKTSSESKEGTDRDFVQEHDIGSNDEEELTLHHKNELENILKRIVTDIDHEPTQTSYTGYWDTLRKVSGRK
jgi:hypothetical protein